MTKEEKEVMSMDDHTRVTYTKLLSLTEFRKIIKQWKCQEITTTLCRDLIVETVVNNMAKVDQKG